MPPAFAKERIGHAQRLLTEIGLEARRIRFVAGTDLDVPDITAIVLSRAGVCESPGNRYEEFR